MMDSDQGNDEFIHRTGLPTNWYYPDWFPAIYEKGCSCQGCSDWRQACEDVDVWEGVDEFEDWSIA